MSIHVCLNIFYFNVLNRHKTVSSCRTLSHPNIVQFYGLATVRPGKVGMVLELCSGDLERYSERIYETRNCSRKQDSLVVFHHLLYKFQD